jgi:minor extracellular serine protease Vpr
MSVPSRVVLVALLALAAGRASAQGAVVELLPTEPVPVAAGGAMVDETPKLWFIELSGAPTSEGGDDTALDAEHEGFRREAAGTGARFTERQSFKSLFNGFSVAASPSQVARLRGIAGVQAVYPVVSIPMPQTTSTSSPELFTALSMTGADVVQNELGLNGKGIKVGIIDTGIDYDNADLGGDGTPRPDSHKFPNSRVVGGYDFVGDAFNADPASPTFNLTTKPDAWPDDCAGHGSHVAGIVGARGFVTGVAPKASLYAYRVFGCEGSTTADVMIAAMERALRDRVDVVNMSIGSAFTWPQYPTAVAANRLVNRGVVVVASIGNSGANGLYSAGSPGLGKDVIGVASYENVGAYLDYFEAGGQKFGFIPATASPLPPKSGGAPLAGAGNGCTALAAGSLAGKIAYVVRGTCTFYAKALNAQNAGAVGMVLANNVSGFVSPTVAGATAIGIPVVAISGEEGAALTTLVNAGPTSLAWTALQASFLNGPGGLISSFSSYGLSPDLDLKPDIGAPGGGIYSTYPLELGGHASLSGTSMASPHVAGTVALLLQARHDLEAREVRGILQNTAQPKYWSLNPGSKLLDGVGRQGAGMVRIDDAVLAESTITPSKLALGESQEGPVTRELEIENRTRHTITYDLTYENTISVAGTFAQSFFRSDATVTFSRNPVTVRSHEEAEVKVTVTPPTGPDKGQYGGYVVFTPRGGGQVLRVPYAGFVGDYQSIQVLAPTPYGFPWLAGSYLGEYYGPVTGPADWYYTMVGEDIPFFLVHFDHPSRLFRLDIYDATSGKLLGEAFEDEYLSRNATSTGFFAISWDGTVIKGNKSVALPNGTYQAKISILKALGNAFNPAHWETWVSPVILIQR